MPSPEIWGGDGGAQWGGALKVPTFNHTFGFPSNLTLS